MIISRQKEIGDILKTVKEQNIFIIGCGKCAAKQRVGGEPEVLEMQRKLKNSGKNVIGWTVLSAACVKKSWDEALSENPDIAGADALLVMSCGGGVSVVSGASGQMVYPALDTESLGGVRGDEVEKELCGMCGECDIQVFGGICPFTKCPKSMRNGPCGGAADGKCEVDGRDCVWETIHERLLSLKRTGYVHRIHEPKDHSKKRRMS